MPDLYHQFGGDLVLSASGDLLTADGSVLGVQRVLRRLLTNPGDYIWQAAYGAGLAAYVGLPVQADAIKAVILNQMQNEARVAQDPSPVVTVASDNAGTVIATIQYVDAVLGTSQTATVPVVSNAP